MRIELVELNLMKGYSMNLVGELLGYIAGICTAICFLPQTIKTIRYKNVEGLSCASYVIYVIGIVSWILYVIYLSSIQMIVFNSISLIFTAIILFMIIKNRTQKK